MKRMIGVILCLTLVCALTVVALPAGVSAAPLQEIKIAGQFGLVYAPLMVAEKLDIFAKYGLKPVWKEYGSGAAVREALISGDALLWDGESLHLPDEKLSEDPRAARAALRALAALDFDALLPGHGPPLLTGARRKLDALLQRLPV
jgi:hypothetical protein